MYFSFKRDIYMVEHGQLSKVIGKDVGCVKKPGRRLRKKAEQYGYIKENNKFRL